MLKLWSNKFQTCEIQEDTEELDVEADMASVHQYIEAVAVVENESQIVYGEITTFGIKYILRERSGRRLLACVCLVLIIGLVAIGTGELLKESIEPHGPQLVSAGSVPTETPMQIGFNRFPSATPSHTKPKVSPSYTKPTVFSFLNICSFVDQF